MGSAHQAQHQDNDLLSLHTRGLQAYPILVSVPVLGIFLDKRLRIL